MSNDTGNEIYIEEYSEKSFVVLGETKNHKESLKQLGGKWNSRLRDGKQGWIFSKKLENNVKNYITDGVVKSTSRLEERIDILEKKIDEIFSILNK